MVKIECQACGGLGLVGHSDVLRRCGRCQGTGMEDDPLACICCGRRALGQERYDALLFGAWKCSDCKEG